MKPQKHHHYLSPVFLLSPRSLQRTLSSVLVYYCCRYCYFLPTCFVNHRYVISLKPHFGLSFSSKISKPPPALPASRPMKSQKGTTTTEQQKKKKHQRQQKQKNLNKKKFTNKKLLPTTTFFSLPFPLLPQSYVSALLQLPSYAFPIHQRPACRGSLEGVLSRALELQRNHPN